ncbi:MAG TPA: hypothetical protein VIM10_15815 [Actinopolymorphaceae bacterium]|jgi:hypothetical protein
MAVRKVVALLTLVAVSALVGCTSMRDASPTASPAVESPAVAAATTPGTGSTPTSKVTAPRFASIAERDTAYIAQLAALTWATPAAGPGYPAKFRRSALQYESSICSDARRAESAAGVTAPTEQLGAADRATLMTLSVLFYCPSLAGSVRPATKPQKATCPRAADILVTSRMSPPMMSDNYFYSTVTYVIAFMNLTDYPVWILPEVKWKAGPIYKGGYPTGDTAWRHSWQLYSDPHVAETTPGRLLKAGEVWRVDAGQAGPYVWNSMSARVDPTAFVPQGCGYQPA